MTARAFLQNTALTIASVLITFLVADYLIAIVDPDWSRDRQIPVRKADAPYLFELDPHEAGNNSLGLRGPEIAADKPDDVYRIIVLGDSVTYGVYVSARQAFPALIEAQLAKQNIDGRRVEVINAGVPAYTTYNQLHFYREKLKAMSPDLLILAYCMNDVVDPFFHWSHRRDADLVVPDAAIPNMAYHTRQLALQETGLLVKLLPYWSNTRRLLMSFNLQQKTLATKWHEGNDKDYPVFLALEQPITMDVYNDYGSQEWRWLKTLIGELSAELRSEQTDFLFMIIPMTYQIASDYPFSPSANFARFCAELQIECLDLLDSMRGLPVEDVFISYRAGFNDVWHFNPRGHKKVAREVIERKLRPMLSGDQAGLVRIGQRSPPGQHTIAPDT